MGRGGGQQKHSRPKAITHEYRRRKKKKKSTDVHGTNEVSKIDVKERLEIKQRE